MVTITLMGRADAKYVLEIGDAPMSIGRAATNDLVVDDPQVSRHHAQISLTGDKLVVTDLVSKNGTWVNGTRIDPSAELRDGDVIRFGTLDFAVQSAEAQTRSFIGSAHQETITVLFTDLEGHTALFEELGTEAAYALVRQHVGMMRDEVEKHGGVVIKTEGDGLIATFTSVRNAVMCSIAIQRRAQPTGDGPRRVPIRIGINTGDAIREGDDVLGLAVIKAARVMAHAQGGEILMTEISRMLLAPEADLEVTPKGRYALKGTSEPERLHQVRWRE